MISGSTPRRPGTDAARFKNDPNVVGETKPKAEAPRGTGQKAAARQAAFRRAISARNRGTSVASAAATLGRWRMRSR